MADTVKTRAKRYATAIAERATRHDGVARKPKITPSLLALARINLQREVRSKLNPKPTREEMLAAKVQVKRDIRARGEKLMNYRAPDINRLAAEKLRHASKVSIH